MASSGVETGRDFWMVIFRKFWLTILLYFTYSFCFVAFAALLEMLNAEKVGGLAAVGTSALVGAASLNAARVHVEERRWERLFISLLVAALAVPMSLAVVADAYNTTLGEVLYFWGTLLYAFFLSPVALAFHIFFRKSMGYAVCLVGFLLALLAVSYFAPGNVAAVHDWTLRNPVFVMALMFSFVASTFLVRYLPGICASGIRRVLGLGWRFVRSRMGIQVRSLRHFRRF